MEAGKGEPSIPASGLFSGCKPQAQQEPAFLSFFLLLLRDAAGERGEAGLDRAAQSAGGERRDPEGRGRAGRGSEGRREADEEGGGGGGERRTGERRGWKGRGGVRRGGAARGGARRAGAERGEVDRREEGRGGAGLTMVR